MATTIDGVLIFISLIFLYVVCVFLLRNLEKLTFKLKTQYPDTWIALGSVRFSGDKANSPEDPWYTWINYKYFCRFILSQRQHSKLSDKEVERLVKIIKRSLLLSILSIVFMFGILYL